MTMERQKNSFNTTQLVGNVEKTQEDWLGPHGRAKVLERYLSGQGIPQISVVSKPQAGLPS